MGCGGTSYWGRIDVSGRVQRWTGRLPSTGPAHTRGRTVSWNARHCACRTRPVTGIRPTVGPNCPPESDHFLLYRAAGCTGHCRPRSNRLPTAGFKSRDFLRNPVRHLRPDSPATSDHDRGCRNRPDDHDSSRSRRTGSRRSRWKRTRGTAGLSLGATLVLASLAAILGVGAGARVLFAAGGSTQPEERTVPPANKI